MKAFQKLTGIAAPLDKANVDTDQLIPKQFLRKIERSGFGIHLFHDWRFKDDAGKVENPEFILNQSPYQNSKILLARDNFGCGSSREHAPWALEDFGFRSVIAPSFADIFYNNCFKNGMLPVVLKSDEVEQLFQFVGKNKGAEVTVDLETQSVVAGDLKFSFSVDPFRKHCLWNGLDDIGLTLEKESLISKFESGQKQSCPWLYSA
jgi:3-isopropylmalate/(R)-2-methylmalate dehydratase small subunit